MNELSEDIREMANQYAELPVKSPEVKLLVKTLLTLAKVIDRNMAEDFDVCFTLKPWVPTSVLSFQRKEMRE